ncbi:MAG: acyl transferase [Flavobacteriales bacterium Tduv]
MALKVFHYQAHHNIIYKKYLQLLRRNPEDVDRVEDIPFLPISFFKTHTVWSGPETSPEIIFTSSGTTGSQSRHHVAHLNVYVESSRRGFEHFYGPIKDWAVLALLPSYLERNGSSLIYLAADLIERSSRSDSGFFLYDHQALSEVLKRRELEGKKTLLLGVSFALLDFSEKHPMPLRNTVVMETGGMKGRRQEMIREALHAELLEAFNLKSIHSEYGMTELLSQAYSKGDGLFETPPWMQIYVYDLEDPLTLLKSEHTGGVNVIDLANYRSCSFIATEDLGKITDKGRFQILGRFDFSDLRGCNLMAN